MPSSTYFSSFMLMTLTLLQLCSATPVPIAMPADLAADCLPVKPSAAAPVLPASTLPTTNLTFAYVAIGRGVQNYTCTALNTTPVTGLGAIATLYDATSLARTNLPALHLIPGQAVNTPPTAAGYVLPPQYRNLPLLGHHLFLSDATPTFDLNAVGKILYAKRLNGTSAPTNAPKGPAGTGAVDWLQLAAKTTYTSVGLSMVYRVETAGGNPPATCTTTGVISMQYAAEYWFYV